MKRPRRHACFQGAQLTLGLVLLVTPRAAAQPFVDVSTSAGLTEPQHVGLVFEEQCGGATLSCWTPFTGGAAVADYDGDGDPDIFYPRFGQPDLLYENQGDGTFLDVGALVGVDGVTADPADTGNSNGAAFADLDNDGDQDLIVSRVEVGAYRLYVNQGPASDGRPRFTEEAAARGIDIRGGGTEAFMSGFGFAVGDYDRDGWPDLFTTAWQGAVSTCGASHVRLFRGRGPDAPGHFEDVTAAAGAEVTRRGRPSAWIFAAAFRDMDDDGWQDLVITGDFHTSRLFWNRGDGTFTDGTEAAGVGTDDNGMGSTVVDFDLDGDLDWFVSSISDAPDLTTWFGATGNRLYRNLGGRTFEDVSEPLGVRVAAWGWGSALFDPDHDGDLDLVVTNGYQFMGADQDITRYYERQGPEVFVERAADVGLADDGLGKGLMLLDYDGDGDQDLFIVRNGQTPLLLRNDGGTTLGHYIRVRATGAAGTRDAYGARVRVTRADGTLVAPAALVDTATHFLGESERVAHVGLGGYDGAVDVEVSFLSGHVVTRTGVAADQTIVVTEPSEPMRPAAGARPTGCAVRQPCAIDCDDNGVPDACEVDTPGADCNDNDVLDVCELASGLASDCDGNGVLDVCDVAAGADGDGDGVPDACAPDLGVVDVGVAALDSGVTLGDAAPQMDDAGQPAPDGGSHDGGAAMNASASTAGGLRGGATCAAGSPNGSAGVAWVFLLLALVVRRRR